MNLEEAKELLESRFMDSEYGHALSVLCNKVAELSGCYGDAIEAQIKCEKLARENETLSTIVAEDKAVFDEVLRQRDSAVSQRDALQGKLDSRGPGESSFIKAITSSNITSLELVIKREE